MKKHHALKIQKKTEAIYKKYDGRLTKMGNPYWAIKEVFERGLSDGAYSPEKAEKVRNLLDSGMFDRNEEIVDDVVAEQLEQEVEQAIGDMIKNGELPPREKTLKAKAKQYVNREINQIKDGLADERKDTA